MKQIIHLMIMSNWQEEEFFIKGDYNMEEKTYISNCINSVLDLHEKMKNHFFFVPPRTSNKRSVYEEKNSQEVEFDFEGKHIRIEQVCRCSGKYVYYYVNYYEDGEQISADIRYLKKILKKLDSNDAA